MSDSINAKIKKVDKILEVGLEIPKYQRPYRWSEENVRQLLSDVFESWKQGKSSYRIGSIILYYDENSETLNIVDGQQRITTILLVLAALESPIGNELRRCLKYDHIDSKHSIYNNKQFIDRWITENLKNDKDDFCIYLTQYCEFVEITVQDLSEAFQMFDSQNGRGKELEAYNLLKAYHIRAMEANTFDEKVDCDRNWENSTRFQNPYKETDVFDILKQIFNEQIYRTRLWSRKVEAWHFDKKKITEFKGISINKNCTIEHPFQNKDLLQYVVQSYFNSLGVNVKGIKSRFAQSTPDNINPFVLINQNIINGKNFFEYIETYVEIYKQLFINNHSNNFLSEFKPFFDEYCISYNGAHRNGDKYLLELYKSMIFILFDKYGEEGVNKYYKNLYALVYRKRLEKIQVRYASIAEYPATSMLFHIIENAKSFIDLQSIEKQSYNDVKCRKEVEKVLEFFYRQGVSIFTNDSKINLEIYKERYGNKKFK